MLRCVSDAYPQLQDAFDWPGSAEVGSSVYVYSGLGTGLDCAWGRAVKGAGVSAVRESVDL